MLLVQKLKDEIESAQRKILEIRGECQHPRAALIHYSTGKTSDGKPIYWCNCGLCGKENFSVSEDHLMKGA